MTDSVFLEEYNENQSILSNEFIHKLYITYKNELYNFRNRNKLKVQHLAYAHKSHHTYQYDDIEAELTFLFLLHIKPKNIIEFSPFCGYSTSIILDALTINNNNATLSSFDIIDNCSTMINRLNYDKAKWNFELGDVTQKFRNWNLQTIDYLFIDSDHSKDFAISYINNLLRPLLKKCQDDKKHVLVSVHDIFHGRPNEPVDDEGKQIINFLEDNNINYYSPSRFSSRGNHNFLMNLRNSLNFKELIKNTHHPTIPDNSNSSIYFILK